ncbi:MAG: glucosyltransferase domain-containing protein [Peptococcaceae bacterium]|nr:glucosyltransferase domain-containing protein [Peptococcaceae bacterium]
MAERTIPMPEEAAKRLSAHLSAPIRWTFLATLILGLVTHLYMLVNKLPNHDDIFYLFQCDYGTLSGRWFLPFVMQWDGAFSMPWLIGVLSLLCLAGTACLSVSLLRIRKPLACVVTAALLVAFPAVTSTFTYMFTADAYFFALFLAAFSAYAVVRFPVMGLPLGAVSLILSMGIYQSYFPVAAVLMVGTLLFDCLEGQLSFLRIVLRGIKMVFTLGISIVVYIAAAHLTTQETGLSDYMGISSMGSVSLEQLPMLIRQCYETYRDYFWSNPYGWYFDFLPVLLQIAAVAAVALLLLLLIRRRVGVLRGLLAVVLAVLYPLAGNLIYIMVAGGHTHFLMIYGAVYALVLPVALTSFAAEHVADMGKLRCWLQALLSWLLLGTMALTAYSYMVADNKAYLKAEISLEQLSAYSNRLVAAIQSSEGYTPETPVLLIGNAVADATLVTPEELSDVFMTGIFGAATYRSEYSYNDYLNRFLALPNTVYLDNDNQDDLNRIRVDVATWMPTYPQAGSIQLVDGYMVVRLN